MKINEIKIESLNYTERRLKIIKDEIEKLNHKIQSIDETWDFSKNYYEYEEALKPYTSKIAELSREKRLIKPYELEPMKNIGTLMSLKQFVKNVKSGGFVDYDGSGNYVKDNMESNITIYPSDVEHNSIRTDFDKIVWYNR